MDEVKQLMDMLGKLGGHWEFDEAMQQIDMAYKQVQCKLQVQMHMAGQAGQWVGWPPRA